MEQVIARRLEAEYGSAIEVGELRALLTARHWLYRAPLAHSQGYAVIKVAGAFAESSSISREGRIMGTLRERGAPVLPIIKTIQGDYALDSALGTPGLFASRMAVPNTLSETPEGFHSCGAALAELHAHLDYLDESLRQTLPLLVPSEQLASAVDSLQSHLNSDASERLGQIEEFLRKRLAAREYSDTGICHGDAHVRNILLVDGQHCWADFEDVFIGPRVYDLATVVWSSLKHVETAPLWGAALRSYSDVNPSAKEWFPSIGAFVGLRHLWWLALHADNWGRFPMHQDHHCFFAQGLELAEIICRDACGMNTSERGRC